MVIFMPHYRRHEQTFHSRARPSEQSLTIDGCKFASNILCRFTFSLFLLIIGLFIFELSIDQQSTQKEGSAIIAVILLIIAVISFLRTCQTLRRYYTVMHTRRRLIERLHERQQILSNAPMSNGISDLPSYKELFPSHVIVNGSNSEPPPSYDDFVKSHIVRSVPSCLWLTDRTRETLSLQGTVTYV